MKESSPLSRRARAVGESSTLAVAERAAKLRSEGVDVVSFGAGEPDFDTPEHIKQAAVEALRKGFTKYTPSSGILPLRRAFADKLRRDNGIDCEPEQVIVSCGAKHAIYNALHALLDPGDEVLIPSPYWTSYPEMVKTAGARPVFAPTPEEGGFKITPRQIESSLTARTKVFIHCSPNNPTGAVYGRDELEALAEVLVDRGIWVIADEVYEKIIYGTRPHVSFASLGREVRERAITVHSCSKTYSMTGWRIGFAAGPRDVIEAAGRIQSQATSNPTSFAQHAAVVALEGDHSFVEPMVREYERRRDTVVRLLRAIPGISLVEPEGAFYVFPRVEALYGRRAGRRALRGSCDLADYLLDAARVAVVPGEGFGSDAHVRLSYATSLDRIEEGMDRIRQAVERLD